MGPKKGKDNINDENYWRMCIEDASLDDDSWKVKVVMLEAAGSDQDRIYLNKFETCAAEERRFVIKNICKTETIFMINQLGGEKKVKDDNLRVFEEGQAYLKEKKDVPPEIMALIIKHLILKMKEEYLFIQRQRLEVREGMKKESVTMINRTEVRGTVNAKTTETEPELPLIKGQQRKGDQAIDHKPTEIDENKKYNTLLRVRGEEWRDKVYIDDYPIDGPNLYVVITGFLEPNLPKCLIKVGIPLTAVVQIRIDTTNTAIPSSLLRATKRGQSQTELLAEKSLRFWEDLQKLRVNKHSADAFKDTAFIIFSPPYWSMDKLSGHYEKIYDELCYLMYDVQDLTRQHNFYLENMDIITVPDDNLDDSFKQYYFNYIEAIPLESVTIYSVLDAILQAVSNFENIGENYSMPSSFEHTNQNDLKQNQLHKSEELVKNLMENFCVIDSLKNKYRITYGEEYENYENPIVINNGDFCKCSTFHLGNINLENLVYSMLTGMPINKLWLNRHKPTGETEAKINFHVNMLLSCFDRNDLETAELYRLIHVLGCRKVYNNRSALKKEHLQPSTIADFKKTFLKRSVLAEPLPRCTLIIRSNSSSPSINSAIKQVCDSYKSFTMNLDDETSRIKFLFECPDISELVSADEIINQSPISHMIDEFEFFEDFKGISAFQVIVDAFNKFNCVDCKYCEVTDCFILMFYNSFDLNGIAREEWRCHLPTPLCLQDFFDFVLEEHYDWIENEEKNYDERIRLRSQSECKDPKHQDTGKSCIENNEISLELLMEGSLKYEELTVMDEVSPETSNSKIVSSKKTNSPKINSNTDLDSKSSKKTKGSGNPTTKIDYPEDEGEAEMPSKPFSGYNLGDRRVEVFGKNSTFFSEDGTRVSTFYSLLIPMNIEFITLNIVTGDSHNEFWIHKAVGENLNNKMTDMSESFRIKTKDQLIINVRKQLFEIPLCIINPFSGDHLHKTNIEKSPTSIKNNSNSQLYEIKSFYSVFITWPNGLITESVHEYNSTTISHIKQYYLTNFLNLNEDMRCVSVNGEVVIFKNDGVIEILKPDSSYIKINKCEKRVVNEVISEDAQSAASSDKSKKAKAKEKGKEKPHKASSKPSKNLLEDENVALVKAAEYGLFIDEFELIESNGNKQKWNNGNEFDVEKLLIKTATNFCLGEIFSRRMDGTNALLNKDGVLIVTFPNNTRIITRYIIDEEFVVPEWTEEEIEYLSAFENNDSDTQKCKDHESQKTFRNHSTESFSSANIDWYDGYVSIYLVYSVENPNFSTVIINKFNGNISIESPNETCVTLNNENNYEFSFNDTTSASFDGQNLNILYKPCSKCHPYDNNCDVKIRSEEMYSVTDYQRNWLKMTDSFGKIISINDEGNISIVPSSYDTPQSSESPKPEESYSRNHNTKKSLDPTISSHAKCRESPKEMSLKFFILRRDLSCSELLHRDLVKQYKKTCKELPWCTINEFDAFGDNRSIWSILTPIYRNESEKWVMESKLSGKPKYLTYKDLKIDSGKGFYHWMRPYKRFKPKPMKPDPILPERLPKAFILRTLEQQWRENDREKLSGAKELINAVLRYRYLMEENSQTLLYVPILDTRSEQERQTDELVQAIAHRIYDDLKKRMSEDVQDRARATITTKPLPPPKDGSVEEEFDGETEQLKIFDQESLIQQVESAEELSPNLKRYWRRRAEEYKEEQFYRYLLRQDSVPPYFRNVLGGAIWWEVNKAADDAMKIVESRKMKCACHQD